MQTFVNETLLQGHWQAGLGLSLVLYGQLYVLCDFGNILDATVIYLKNQLKYCNKSPNLPMIFNSTQWLDAMSCHGI